jgi:hypothetical protein
VFVTCFDRPGDPVEINCALLEQYDCRLSKVITYDGRSMPGADGHKTTVCAGPSMTRATLVSVVQSMAVGELLVGRGTTTAEVLAALTYEGVSFSGSSAIPKQRNTPAVEVPQLRLDVVNGRLSAVHTELTRLCTQVALSLTHWPRLECGLVAAIEGRPSCGFHCSGSRCWLQFLQCPRLVTTPASAATTAESIEGLAKRWPRFIAQYVTFLEILHGRRMRLPTARPEDAHGEQVFRLAVRDMDADHLGRFAPHRCDLPSQDTSRSASALRRELHEARANVNNLRMLASTAVEAAGGAAPGANRRLLLWARAAVAFAQAAAEKLPNLHRLFDAQLGADTLERRALQRVLKQHGIRIERWSETNDPIEGALCFPGFFFSSNSARNAGPACLISVA